jgi:hypothetical protein
MSATALIGLIAFSVALLLVGLALLAGAGVARSRRELLHSVGLALFIGWAMTGLCVSFELMLGLHATLWEVLAGQALIAGGALAVGRRVGAMRPRRAIRERSLLAGVSAALVGLYLIGMLADALVPRGLGNSEGWSQWLVKAKVIYYFGLATGIGGYTQQQNGTYPPLDSALESTTWHFAGTTDILVLPLMHWIVFAALIAAFVYVLAPRVRPKFLWPPLAMLVLAPNLAGFVGSSLGEELVAEFLGLATVLGALWLLENEPRWLALACALFGAASLTKNEGLVMSLILTALIAVAGRRKLGLVLVASPLAVQLPWKIWQRAHHVPPTFGYDWGRYAHPGALAHHFDYVVYGAESLLRELLAPGHWLVIVPLAIALGAVLARRRNPLAVLAIGFPILTFFAFEGTYWAGKAICEWAPSQPCTGTRSDIDWLVALSAGRLPLYFVVVAAAMLPLLLAEADAKAS